MNALLILVPISLIWIAIAIWALLWAVRRGQFSGLDSSAFMALELEPAPRAEGVEKHNDDA